MPNICEVVAVHGTSATSLADEATAIGAAPLAPTAAGAASALTPTAATWCAPARSAAIGAAPPPPSTYTHGDSEVRAPTSCPASCLVRYNFYFHDSLANTCACEKLLIRLAGYSLVGHRSMDERSGRDGGGGGATGRPPSRPDAAASSCILSQTAQ